MQLAPLFAFQSAQLHPEDRAKLLMGLLGLILIGLMLIAMVILGARWVRRLTRQNREHPPLEDRWWSKPLVPKEIDESESDN